MELELVVLIGLQASGKSSFYRDRLAATHALVSKDLMPNVRNKGQRQREHVVAHLAAGRSVVVDNTNVRLEDRAELIALAREHGARAVGYVFETPLQECLARNAKREGKARVPPVAVHATAKRLKPPTRVEGFDALLRVRIAGDGGFEVHDQTAH